MNKYARVIHKSLSKINSSYFKIVTNYSDEEINRERVFCYELYHQMRNMMKQNSIKYEELSLHAEVDKSGNPSFNRQNPDFIFHKPGTDSLNELVCEVKGLLDGSGINKDFNTIITLMTQNHYKNGVFVIYSYSIRELLEEEHGLSQQLHKL